jgi:nucleoside-diphosphate-sugar epimerase
MAQFPQLIVLGASGFLGTAMPRAFLARFGEVLALSSRDCDLTDSSAVIRASAAWRADAIVLFAAVARTEAPAAVTVFAPNLRMAENVATAARNRGAAGVIFTSSAAVYGSAPANPLREGSPVQPDSGYGRTKLDSESVLRECLDEALPLAIFRCPQIYDLSDRDRSVIKRFVRTARSAGEIPLHNQGRNRRDFIYAADLFTLFSLWLERPVAGLWNAASGTSPRMLEVAQTIVAVVGAGTIHPTNGGEPEFDLVFDCTALQRTFGQNPLRSFPEAFPEVMRRPRPVAA